MIRTLITYSHDPEKEGENFVRSLAEGLKSAAVRWHQEYAKRHFTPMGGVAYGYRIRSAKYLKRKLRVKHHTYPLVWSGTLRDAILKSAPTPRMKRRGSEITGYVTFRVPKYFYQYRGAGPKKDEELFTTLEPEREVLKLQMLGTLAKRFERSSGGRRRVV